MNVSKAARAPCSPGFHAARKPPAQSIRGSRRRSSRAADDGHSAGDLRLFGGLEQSAGASLFRHAFQKAENTWNGLPPVLVRTVAGSNSRLALKLSAWTPFALSDFLMLVSRAITAGS